MNYQQKTDLQTEEEKLMQLSRDWSELAKTGDPEKILQVWADDAILMPPDSPPLRGKEAIKGFLKEALSTPGFQIRWEPMEVHISSDGDMAYMIEKLEMTVNDPSGNPVKTYHKVTTVWGKQDDGSWKNVVDTWNSDPQGNF